MSKNSIKMIRKTNLNSRTKQLTITIPKRKLPISLRYEQELFVELKILKKGKRR